MLLLLFIALGILLFVTGVFLSLSVLLFLIKWGLIGVGIYLAVRELMKILR